MMVILKMDVDFLWFGGIGIYICVMIEMDVDVGDWVNDYIWIIVFDVGVKVIGEGVNFGLI